MVMDVGVVVVDVVGAAEDSGGDDAEDHDDVWGNDYSSDDDDEDAVRIANDSDYGLSGMIHSADLDRAKGVARRIRTGTLGINNGVWYGADAPFGGYKESGYGREGGRHGLLAYLKSTANS